MSSSVLQTDTPRKPRLLPRGMLYPFVLVTLLFPLWGFPNDFTNPLVRVFKELFLISNWQSSFVQFAFYGGYATMALPAAIFIRRYTYKAGIQVGLTLFALGSLLTIPAAQTLSFNLFLVSLYVMTFGLAFLETTANPYILSMGDPETATQRLNLAQAFNPAGAMLGMIVASQLILPSLAITEFRTTDIAAHPEYQELQSSEVDARVTASMHQMSIDDPAGFGELKSQDLQAIRLPYLSLAVVVVALLIVMTFSKLPDTGGSDKSIQLAKTFDRLYENKRYVGGVIAQMFYVGAQIMCWTFIIHYGITNLGLDAATAQKYNILAMGIFLCSRFICTLMLKFLKPGLLLAILAMGGIALMFGTIFLNGYTGLYCLVATSACMSLMYPTIYGIALEGLGEDAKLGSAGLVFAIIGGCLMPPMQGWLIDLGDPATGMVTIGQFTLTAVSASFVLPLICFVVVAIYGISVRGPRRPIIA